jgi:hypothetical protein
MRKFERHHWLGIATTLLVAACGGGGGGGDGAAGGPTPPVPSTPPPGGAEKTVLVTGAISGFGSVIVNGVRYDTSGTEVRIDDRVGTIDELRVGHVIRLDGRVDDRGNARAVRIEQGHLLSGTVQSVDAATGTLTVAGQRVRIDDDTSFDDRIAGGGLAGLVVGERIEVHGFTGSDGRARATRIEKSQETEIEVTGLVAAHDAAVRRFRVGELLVDYSSAVLEDLGSAGLQDGLLVEVKGRELLPDGALRATRIHREDGGTNGGLRVESEVEGLVTRFVSPADFSVAGQRVRTVAGTVYVGGAAADIALDRKLEVEGRLEADGVLVASKVAFKQIASVRIAAPVEAVDAAGGTVRALGLTIVVDASTRREDKQGDDHFFALADLRVGDWIEVRGYPDTSVAGRVIAVRLERDDPEDEVELRGPAANLEAPRFRILGVPVETTPATEFEESDARIDAATFFARATGRVVEVDGRWNGTNLVADEAEIESPASPIPPPVTPPGPVTPPPVNPPPPVTPPLDGAALYATNCASCHGPITAIRSMSASNRNAADFRRAIVANRGGMGALASLTDAQLVAIAAAISAANP